MRLFLYSDHRRLCALATISVLLIAGCSGLRVDRSMLTRPGDWAMYGGGPSRTNVSQSVVRPPFREVWQYNAQAGISGTPLVRDSVMVVGTLLGEIQAVNIKNGRRLGYKVMEGSIVGTPALDGSKVIFAMSGVQQSVVAMDLGNGERVWIYAAGPVESAPLLYENFVYVTTLQGSLICLEKSDGKEVWKFETEEKGPPIRSSPATDGKVICFGSDDGHVYGVDRASGSLLWKTDAGASVFASPIIASDLVIVGTINGIIVALDAATGTLRWSYATGSRIYSAAAGERNVIYAGSANGVLHALDSGTGALVWKFEAKSVIGSAPLVASGLIFVGALDKKLYMLDSATGKELWQFEAEGRIRVSPVLWGDYLLVTSEDKYITALRPESIP
ncbi:MAG: PQQ-binding-like beta-propeller repeat protein [Bacteroidota bacterium]